MNADRKAWERDSILEDVELHGFAQLSKQKYLSLAGYLNWCASANQVWLTDWRKMKQSAKADLDVKVVADQLFLIDIGRSKISDRMSKLS